MDVRIKWDNIHAKADRSVVPEPCRVLTDYQFLLPSQGTALDLACGLGGNALYLADRGYGLTAIDISSVAIERINDRNHPLINACCESIDTCRLEQSAFDIIVVSNYLNRSVCTSITDALVPGGVLFYQTFVQQKVDPAIGPSNPDYLLAPNELLSLFNGLHVLAFSDPGCCGDINQGPRNQSYLVARKDK